MAEKRPPSEKRAVSIDWEQVRRRIEDTRDVLARGFTPPPDEIGRILKSRAESLAREPEKEGVEEVVEVVEFLLSYENYGIESSFVREVYPLKDFTPLPCTPPFVFGIINVRGQILSVIDLRKFFDLPEKGLTDLNKVIILRQDGMEFGILADAVPGVRLIPLGDIQPSLPTLTGIREGYLKGVTGERVTILDAGKLLADRSIIVHEQVEL